MNEQTYTPTNGTTITILTADFSHVIKKTDVWLLYTTKSNRPWVCVPDSITYHDDIVVATLSTNVGLNND